MVLGVLAATAGNVEIDGIDISKRRAKALARTNFAAVYAALPGNLTVAENLRFFGLLYGIAIAAAARRGIAARNSIWCTCAYQVRGAVLRRADPGGSRQGAAQRPQLLLLDEPTASLDPSAAQIIRAKIKSLATENGCGMLWTSHNMNEVAEVCDRVLFLSRGKVLLEGRSADSAAGTRLRDTGGSLHSRGA